MKEFFAVAGTIVGSLAAVLALVWIVQGNDFFLYKVFAPKYEQVRHDTFKESQAYNDGMANEFYRLKQDYANAQTESQRDAIKDVVRHRASQYDVRRLPGDLQRFIADVR